MQRYNMQVAAVTRTRDDLKSLHGYTGEHCTQEARVGRGLVPGGEFGPTV